MLFRIFALNSTNGNLEAIFTIKGALNCDWEDLAVGPGPLGQNYIYIGDIGGNTKATCNTIYRVVEPLIIRDQELDIHGELRFTWDAPNCETLMVDQQGTLYLVSKVKPVQIPRLYKIPNVGWRFKKIHLQQGRISQDTCQKIHYRFLSALCFWIWSITTFPQSQIFKTFNKM